MAKMFDCGLEVREFELESYYNVYFGTTIFSKGAPLGDVMVSKLD